VLYSAQLCDALARREAEPFDVLLWDFRLSDSDGVEMLERVKDAAMRVPIIVLADSDDAAQALQALRVGAQDCIVRSELETASLARSLRHAIERHRSLQQLREAGEQARHLASHDSLTGLANRSAFQSLLDHGLALAQRHDSRLALLFPTSIASSTSTIRWDTPSETI
jgi:PleD family two-component response regulator